MNVAVSVGLAFAAVIGVCLFVLWYGSAGVIDEHEDRIAGMEKWRAETFGGPATEHAAGPSGSSPLDGPLTPVRASDDSVPPDDAKTDEIPVAPATVPDGMPLAVQSALLRPSPVPRGKSAEWVEAELERVRARIDAAQKAS